MSQTKVFFDVAADGKPLGRIEMIMFDDVVPKTTANFKALAKGIFNPKYIMYPFFLIKQRNYL